MISQYDTPLIQLTGRANQAYNGIHIFFNDKYSQLNESIRIVESVVALVQLLQLNARSVLITALYLGADGSNVHFAADFGSQLGAMRAQLHARSKNE